MLGASRPVKDAAAKTSSLAEAIRGESRLKKPKFKWKSRQLDLFWYWLNERHRIYVAKKAGKPWPWTKDKILQEYKFTNVFRQLDRVTTEWTDRFCHLLGAGKDMKDEDILFQLCMFRMFNWPATYDALYYGVPKLHKRDKDEDGKLKPVRWNLKKALKVLKERRDDHEQLFTGAYIITNLGRKEPKYEVIATALDEIWQTRGKMAKRIKKGRKMETAVEVLSEIPTIGGFIGYEIVCDLRHTRILNDALDINSWANPGPGAKRGIHRLLTGNAKLPGKKPNYQRAMRALLKMSPGKIGKHIKNCEWPFEMREIEHSLCEFDKMMRVKNGEGKPRSCYNYKDPKERVPWEE